MGKRKRGDTADLSNPPFISPPPSDIPCSSGMDMVSAELNPSHHIGNSIVRPISSVMGTMDSPAKQPIAQLSLGHHQYNPSRMLFLKRSRHHYGHRYSRRNSSSHNSASASHSKSAPFLDGRLCFKVGGKCNSEFGHHRGKHITEKREKGVWRQERIRSSLSVMNAATSMEPVRMVCGICQKSLRWFLVVAVLVCGHAYHAECLEHRTHLDDIQDPPCPSCSGSLSKAEAA
ncbi:hypothetical protein Ancab_006797 [Ancistrocladus abbreviatus]